MFKFHVAAPECAAFCYVIVLLFEIILCFIIWYQYFQYRYVAILIIRIIKKDRSRHHEHTV